MNEKPAVDANIHPLLHKDNEGNTPLHSAAKNGHVETVKTLLEWAASVSDALLYQVLTARTLKETTPMMLAATHDNGVVIMQEMLNYAKNLEARAALNNATSTQPSDPTLSSAAIPALDKPTPIVVNSSDVQLPAPNSQKLKQNER